MHQLETLLESTVDKTFDKFEIYTLRNILTIPDDLAPWMRLGHYEVRLPFQRHGPQWRQLVVRYMVQQMLTARAEPRSPSIPFSPYPRISPVPSAQTGRNAKVEPCPPLKPLSQCKPRFSTQRTPIAALDNQWHPASVFSRLPHIVRQPCGAISEHFVLALLKRRYALDDKRTVFCVAATCSTQTGSGFATEDADSEGGSGE